MLLAVSSPADRLAALDRGFRRSYLDYDALTAQVHAWADAFPDLCRVQSLGETAEGRALWQLTIGPDPDRVRPAEMILPAGAAWSEAMQEALLVRW